MGSVDWAGTAVASGAFVGWEVAMDETVGSVFAGWAAGEQAAKSVARITISEKNFAFLDMFFVFISASPK
jgi:hypothetical protein